MSALTLLKAPTSGEIVERLDTAAGPDRQPVADMVDLAVLVRAVLDIEAERPARVRLGGNGFEVVVTSSSVQALAAVEWMDEQQGGCGPVIEDPEAGWLYWLVPPGTRSRWERHPYAECVGGPHTITLPPLTRHAPPGPYWLRPKGADRLVPAGPLREVLIQTRPEPAPHAALAAHLTRTSPSSP
ncbi:hypothetical protein MHW47_05170 [Streptomyces sp. OfavH-34-F]|uniref:hypothetical protein n=1 Tax=Streptomyces sp. OfavH-34-F TaxID=2917760 RepID=UPI001EF1F38C|nr:hypothetical protein [Streptomyces sp. OfavH-34-F]MCG7523839.1 hypothetical protein [Streptomyces sp. OfavH-34-F]